MYSDTGLHFIKKVYWGLTAESHEAWIEPKYHEKTSIDAVINYITINIMTSQNILHVTYDTLYRLRGFEFQSFVVFNPQIDI